MSALSVIALLEDERDLALLPIASALGETTALTVAAQGGRARAEATLARAMHAGAKAAVILVDPILENVDYLAIAHVLACAVRHLCDAKPDAPIVLFAGDRGRGAVGPAVAERLSMPHLGAVVGVEARDASLRVTRRHGPTLRSYSGAPPVLLACALPTAAAPSPAVDAPAAAILSLDLATLKITTPELQYRRHFRPAAGVGPSPRPHVVSNVEMLSQRLVRDGLWPLPSPERDG
jgi:electron transfer flavoprotein alpha/beta subunit